MKITFELDDDIIGSYLDAYNEINGTDHSVESLTKAQTKNMVEEFGNLAQDEFEMRCDDHFGFDTPHYFKGVL